MLRSLICYALSSVSSPYQSLSIIPFREFLQLMVCTFVLVLSASTLILSIAAKQSTSVALLIAYCIKRFLFFKSRLVSMASPCSVIKSDRTYSDFGPSARTY